MAKTKLHLLILLLILPAFLKLELSAIAQQTAPADFFAARHNLSLQIDRLEDQLTLATANINRLEGTRHVGSLADIGIASATETIARLTQPEAPTLERLQGDSHRAQALLTRARQFLSSNNLSESERFFRQARSRTHTLTIDTQELIARLQTAAEDGAYATPVIGFFAGMCAALNAPLGLAIAAHTAIGGAGAHLPSGNTVVPVEPFSSVPVRTPPRSSAVPQPQAGATTSGAQTNAGEEGRGNQGSGESRAMRAYRAQLEYQRRLSQRAQRAIVTEARVRPMTELITIANQALPEWHSSGRPPIDWGRFLIEAEAASTTPRMSQHDYDRLLEAWRGGQERARQSIQGISDPLLKMRALAQSWLRSPLSGPADQYATLSDCLLGRSVSSSCAARMIVSSMQTLALPTPPGQTLGLQIFSDGVRPVLWERSSGRTTNLLNGATELSVRGEIYETALMDHTFLTEQQRQGHQMQISLPINALLLAREQPLVLAGATQATSSEQQLQIPALSNAQQLATPVTPLAVVAATSPPTAAPAPIPGPTPTPVPPTPPSQAQPTLPTAAAATATTTTPAAATPPPPNSWPVVATPQSPGPRARLRPLSVINQQIRQGLLQWRQTGRMPFDWVSLSLEAEATKMDPLPSQAQYDQWQATWHQRYEEAVAAARAAGPNPVARIEAARNTLINSTIHQYTRDSASLITSMSDQGGNCQTSTQLLATALLLGDIAPPPGEQYVIQTFSDHVQFATYNPTTHVVWDILGNTRTNPFPGDLYRPTLMGLAHLSVNGEGVSLPYSKESQLVARSSMPAEEPSDHPEISPNMRNTLGWPGARQNASAGPIPAFTTITVPASGRADVVPAVRPVEPPRSVQPSIAPPAPPLSPQSEMLPTPSEARQPAPTANAPIPPLLQQLQRTEDVAAAISADRAIRNQIDTFVRGFGNRVNGNAVNGLYIPYEFEQNLRRLLLGQAGPLTRATLLQVINDGLSDMIRNSHIDQDSPVQPDLAVDVANYTETCRHILEATADLPGIFTGTNPRPLGPQDDMHLGIHLDACNIGHGFWRELDRLNLRQRQAYYTHQLEQRLSMANVRRNVVTGLVQRYRDLANTRIPTTGTFESLADDYFAARIQSEPALNQVLDGIHPNIPTDVIERARSLLLELSGDEECMQLILGLPSMSHTDGTLMVGSVAACQRVSSLQNLWNRVHAYQNRIQADPLATVAALGQVRSARSATPLIDIGRAPVSEPQTSPSPGLTVTPDPINLAALNSANRHLNPLIALLGDRRKVSIVHRPPSGRRPERPAPVRTSPIWTDGNDEPIDVIILGTPSTQTQMAATTGSQQTPPAAAGQGQNSQQAGVRTPSQDTVRLYQPGLVRLSLSRFTEMILDLDRETNNHDLLRARWCPEMARFLGSTSPQARELRRQYITALLPTLVRINPGTIRTPFGDRISRDLARVLYRVYQEDPTLFWGADSGSNTVDVQGLFPSNTPQEPQARQFVEMLRREFANER